MCPSSRLPTAAATTAIHPSIHQSIVGSIHRAICPTRQTRSRQHSSRLALASPASPLLPFRRSFPSPFPTLPLSPRSSHQSPSTARRNPPSIATSIDPSISPSINHPSPNPFLHLDFASRRSSRLDFASRRVSAPHAPRPHDHHDRPHDLPLVDLPCGRGGQWHERERGWVQRLESDARSVERKSGRHSDIR